MKPVLVLYATREGHTRRIAEAIARRLRNHQLAVDLREARGLGASFALDGYGAVVLAASVHGARHEPEMVEFVSRNRPGLSALPSAFLSVSLTEAAAENTAAAAEVRAKARAEVQQNVERFFEETGFRTAAVEPVAGALLYTQYGILVRFAMKYIAKRNGGDTDASRDYEYTDWQALDRFTDDFAEGLESDGEQSSPRLPLAPNLCLAR